MKHKYIVCGFKFGIALTTFLVSLLLAVSSISLQEWIMAIVLIVISVIFFLITVINGSCVTIDNDGISSSFCGISLKKLAWNEVEEVGVVGTKIFNANNPKHTGTRYIYIMSHKLNDNERFKLAMEWPPLKTIYLQYTKDRLNDIQFHYKNEIESYNAGDIFF